MRYSVTIYTASGTLVVAQNSTSNPITIQLAKVIDRYIVFRCFMLTTLPRKKAPEGRPL